MPKKIICDNEYVKIYTDIDGVYIKAYKRGFPSDQLYRILSTRPEISITSFAALQNALSFATAEPQKFGALKERISIVIVDNGLKADIIFNLPAEELDMKNREKLISETLKLLNEKGITFGIKHGVLSGEILPCKTYVIAEGIPPVDGSDAVIKLYEPEEPKPELREDGKVNFYELKLINRVKAGDWLGERIDATAGIPGKTVRGEPIKPVKGKNFPLNYDRNSVQEISINGKTVLYSLIDGAFNCFDGRISVQNHVVIDGDVGLGTGNVKVDGYLTINGTITEGFSVEATRDIEINSNMGLANVSAITSTNGSIFIKGGIFSKGDVEVRAAKSIYIKFVDNTRITCCESLHIGYYCFNSDVTAREVILDSSDGQLCGGQIKAEIRVRAPVIGSEIEKKTCIEVTGFDRKVLTEEFGELEKAVESLLQEQQKLKQVLAKLEELEELSFSQQQDYNRIKRRIVAIQDGIKALGEKRKLTAGYLRTRGEGEIKAGKRIYPNCTLIIKGRKIVTAAPSLSVTYFYLDGELKCDS